MCNFNCLNPSIIVYRPGGHGGARKTLSQSEACYYQPYHKHLACQCVHLKDQTQAYLPLNMKYWVQSMGQQVAA